MFGQLLPGKKASLVHHYLNGQIQLAFPIEEYLTILGTEAPDQLIHEIRNRLALEIQFCLFADHGGKGRKAKRFNSDFHDFLVCLNSRL